MTELICAGSHSAGVFALLRSMLKCLVDSLKQRFDHVELLFMLRLFCTSWVSEKDPQVLLSWY